MALGNFCRCKSRRSEAISKWFRWMTASLALLAMTTAHAYTWQVIDEGLSYTNIDGTHAFQIDPRRFKFDLLTAKDSGDTDTTSAALARKSNAPLVVNGGFFSPEHKSLGLLVRNGQILNPLHPTHWWGVFQIRNGKPSIVPPQQFQNAKGTEMALQAGPRLVVEGEVQKLKPSVDLRSGIGIQKNGNVVIAVTGRTPLSLTAFANLFRKPEKEGGLECMAALNLDGGDSTQLYFKWKGSQIDLPGLSRIANGIALFPR